MNAPTKIIPIKISQVGNSLGVILPKEVLAALKVGKGDQLILSETADGFRLTPYDPELAQQIEAGREFMKEYRDTLRALAK
jgi:putative addiction module antidote